MRCITGCRYGGAADGRAGRRGDDWPVTRAHAFALADHGTDRWEEQMEAPAAATAAVTALALHTGARGRPYTAPAVTGADERERERCRCRVLPAGALTLRTPHAVVDSPCVIEAARTGESSGAAAGAWECSGRIRRW